MRRLQRPTLSVGDQVDLGGIKLRALLFLALRIFGNTLTKVAGMLSIKSFADPDFHSFGFGVFDQHAHPSRNLESSPVPSRNLQEGQSAKEDAQTRPHLFPLETMIGLEPHGNV
jgi:hypothetical protein